MSLWVKASGNCIPDNAIRAGYEENGCPLFIARAFVDGKLTPGKCGTRTTGGAYIPYGGKEHHIKDYEVLAYPEIYKWQPAANGIVPENAVKISSDLYVGRVYYSGSMIPCKISISRKLAFFGYMEEEHTAKDYEVLCYCK